MVMTGGPPHSPVTAAFGGTVAGREEVSGVAEAAWRLLMYTPGVETSVAVEKDDGVHVGGIVNGVTVGICREGPRGLFKAPEYSQKTNAKTAMASTARIARTIFWNKVITCSAPGNYWRS
jgi:hypothetical protein